MTAPLVIVGAGSAGAVIAARVTEGGREVVLVEAGPDYPDPSALPDDLVDGGRNSMHRHDWGYKHRPNENQVVFPFPRGRVVGGSSAVNTCIALRGQPEDYDEWAALGLAEWSWEQCLPAFVRLERDLDFADAPWHGRDGPLPLRRHPSGELAAWQAAFLEACDELGLERCADSNEPGTVGAGPHAMNKVEGRRVSAAEAWLTPAVRERANLTVRPDTLCRRVLFENRRAIGLEVETAGEVSTLAANEVVLCAGALNTPGILLRSGLGPRAELARLGVEEVADVEAVGAQYLDHPGAAFFMRPRFGAPTSRKDPLIQTVYRYTSEGSDFPADIQIQPGSRLALPRVNVPLVSMMCCLGKPRGRGHVRWPSAHPTARPLITSRILEDGADRAQAVAALTLGLELVHTAPMRALARHFWPRYKTLRDPEAIHRWVLKACDSGYHPCGTVPMGAESDPAAACDGRGRVRGVTGLRVADASLFPTIPSSNTNLPTLMLGERFGEWLR